MSVSRRAVIVGSALASVVAVCPELLAAPDAAAAPPAMRPKKAEVLTSANGWEVVEVANAGAAVWTRPVPGSGLALDVRVGIVETVLIHLIRRYHYEVATLRDGDLVGWQAPGTIPNDGPVSNLASGTAVRIRPSHLPAGVSGGHYPAELDALRGILDEFRGIVSWGGDDGVPDESLFWITARPQEPRLKKFAAAIRDGFDRPGHGAGRSEHAHQPA